MIRITEPEYVLMKKFIEDHCGIHLEKDKEYLIESRLFDLLVETGCRCFFEFHEKARSDTTGTLRDRVVDAVTTNETSWFRDLPYWNYVRDKVIPELIERSYSEKNIKIWSAAVSTGQEIFSFLMLLDETLRQRNKLWVMDCFDIIGSDISSSALRTAKSGLYESIAMNRGLPQAKMEKYFRNSQKKWRFEPDLIKRVKFFKFNLQNDFIFPGPFDLIFCRYVSIYFSDSFKRDLFKKMAKILRPGGLLILGATESLREYSDDFEIVYEKGVIVNIRK